MNADQPDPTGRIERNKAFLTRLFAGGTHERPGFIVLPAMTGVFLPPGDYTLGSQPVERWLPRTLDNYQRQVAMHQALDDDSVPLAPLSTGTHIYAAAFGSKVHAYTDNNPAALPAVWTAAQADALEAPDIWKSPTLYRVFELAGAVQKELGKDVPLAGPDAQTGFDTACLVWNKQDLYLAMMDPGDRDAVKRLTDKCRRLLQTFWIELAREFPTMCPCHCPPVWTPPGTPPQVSNDECGSMSTAMFEEFCLPELVELSRAWGGIGMHCCADAEHQFGLFNRIPGWRYFNRVAAKRGYLPLLDHFAGPAAPVHVLAWVDDASIGQLLAGAAQGTRFVFCRMGVQTVADGRAWLDRMHALADRRQAATR